ncbi:EAL domain-containing protein [Altererythrobacter confluentis]|uniref:EAL domain-containing protein n=1 Tax=Allopontixanthobacter confluentis TaxID=1849021 RepID=A0A6L7GLC9_9SPHN|nr:EAL domain-containing protein [Allopontixanthobacter confluentis]MXP15451.1 EAL domain-containing protein [Allopontixanthobacter confluentis]
MISTLKQIWGIDRIRQVLIAAILASFLGPLFFYPVGHLIWHSQARLASHEASGDIVFAGARDDLTDPEFPHRREQLANSLRALDAAGARKIYIDLLFNQPSDPAADKSLHDAIADLGDKVYFVRRKVTGLAGATEFHDSVSAVMGQAHTVPNDRFINFTGNTWSMPIGFQTEKEIELSFPASMAEINSRSTRDIEIIYSFDPATIPNLELSSIDFKRKQSASDASIDALNLDRKIVVIGNSSQLSDSVANIPGQVDLPSTYVSIYAAETLKAGFKDRFGTIPTFIFYFIALLTIVSICLNEQVRRLSYLALCLSAPLLVFLFAQFGIRANLSWSLALLMVFGMLRLRDRWQSKFALTDAASKLPTFRALERLLDRKNPDEAIVVAKIHRLDEVLSTLPEALHADYILRITDRLRVVDKKLEIYTSGDRYLAWLTPEANMGDLDQHLKGLRGLFAQPLLVGNTAVDVGITFGVDRTRSIKGRQRVALALTATEQTNEAYRPVQIAEEVSETDRLWNISLQSKIDAALSKGEIYVVFQPQISLHDGSMVGAEALVRWDDPLRGSISPAYFIEQCEMAGRMEHLTRHVLMEAVAGFISLGTRTPEPALSVNLSATLLHDPNILNIVDEVLDETGFDPRRLVLEITETSKITDAATALALITQFKSRGIRISLDDFGIGSASLETFLQFPFDELKIDRLFISAMQQSSKAQAIVKKILAMGEEARITVIAEGIEDEQTLKILGSFGLHIAQGYAISYPLRIDDLLQFQGLSDSRARVL